MLNFQNIVQAGEGLHSEFKTSFKEDVIETLVAFSNAKGGTVYIGISDKGVISGVSIGKETLQNWINEVKNKTMPQIIPDAEIHTVYGKEVVSFNVSEYPVKPVSTRGRYYKRVGNSNHLLSVNEVSNMHLQTINSSWDYYPRPGKTLNDISIEKVEKVMKIIMQRNSTIHFDSAEEFLVKNELLIDEGKISNGCYLMFCKEDNLFTTIQLGLFASEIVIKDDMTSSGDILTQVDEVMSFVKKHINKELIITDKQIETSMIRTQTTTTNDYMRVP
jgi:ATP-dependent DNA helicase RecG